MSEYRYRTITARQAAAKGLRPQETTAVELRDLLAAKGEDATAVVWQSFGSIAGQEQFATTRIRFNAELDRVEVFISDGNTVCAYPIQPAVNHAKPGRILVR